MFANLPSLPSGYQPEVAITKLAGGLDLESPTWGVIPGAVRDALNYEACIEGGYQDIVGYERFDGSPAPSDASFTIIDVTITGSIVVGDTVTGATTGDTGVVIATTTYPDDPAQTYLVLTKVVGAWDNATEDIEVTATVEGNVDAIGYSNSAPTSQTAAQYNNLAADEYRTDIAVVTGEGDVWGGFLLGAKKYAIRNKVGSLTAGLFESTVSGWSEVALNEELAFTSGGTHEILEGDTLTGATSTETAVVERLQVTSGTWGAGTAAGWLILSAKSGAFQAENLDEGANSDVCTIAGDAAAATLEPGGRLDFDLSNFADPAGAERMYGADGVNTAYEFDGTVFAKIRTGMVADTPTHIKVHKYQLFLSFVSSVQHSAPGDPWGWSVIVGAAEIATGFVITGFDIQPGSDSSGGSTGIASLLVCCRQRLFLLYGNDVSDWQLVRYREKVGAYEWTIQQVAYTLFLDDRGVTDLQTSQRFGNFDHSSLSNMIRSLVNSKRLLAIASCVVRDKNQYRLFFSDKTALYVTMDAEKLMGIMPVQLEHQVTCMWSQENASGSEEIYFGCDDGFVYQMEKGTSFDGDAIYAYIYTHYDNGKSIEWMKNYEGPVTLEGKGTGYAEMDVAYQLDYNRAETSQPDSQTAEIPIASGSSFDDGLIWDAGVKWDDASTIPVLNLDLRGEGRNISWVITKDSDYFLPVCLTGIHYRFIRKHPIRG
jgi:hypothetical protein